MRSTSESRHHGLFVFLAGTLAFCSATWAQNEHCATWYNPTQCGNILWSRPVDLPPTGNTCGNAHLTICDNSDAPASDPCLSANTGDPIRIRASWNGAAGECKCFDEVWVMNTFTRARAKLVDAYDGGCGPGEPGVFFDTTVPMPDLNHYERATAELIPPTNSVEVGGSVRMTLRVTNPTEWPVTVYMKPGSDDYRLEGLYLNNHPMSFWPAEVRDSVRVTPSERITVNPGGTGEFTVECKVFWPGPMVFDAYVTVGDYQSYFPQMPVPPLYILTYWTGGRAIVNFAHKVQVSNIEPVQVVYGAALVARKPALVRVTFDNLTGEAVTRRVLVAMPHNAANSNDLWYAIEDLEIPAGQSTRLLPTRDWQAPDGKAKWLLPDAPGNVTVSIDPEVVVNWPAVTGGAAPKTLSKQVDVKVAPALKVHFTCLGMPVKLDGALHWMNALDADTARPFVEASRVFLNATYPMKPIDPLPDATRLPVDWTAWVGDNPNLNYFQDSYLTALRVMDSLARTDPDIAERVVGILPIDFERVSDYFSMIGQRGSFGETKRNWYGVVVNPYTGIVMPDQSAWQPHAATTAHELGHTFGMPKCFAGSFRTCEEYEWYPPDGRRASEGVWVEGRTTVVKGQLLTEDQIQIPSTTTAFNFMGREPEFFVDGNPARGFRNWVTLDTYTGLLDKLSAPSRPDPEVLFVSGWMADDGTVFPDPWVRGFTNQPSVSNGSGAYSIVFRGSEGQEIGRFGFDGAASTDPLDLPPTKMSFSLAVPTVPGIASIQIYEGATLRYNRVVNSGAQNVTVISPSADETLIPGSTYAINWSGSDGDGDALRYTVMLSDDNGGTWTPLTIHTQQVGLSWTVPDVDASCARIRIRATDGFNTVEGLSDCFKIQGTPTSALVARPGPAQATTPGVAVQLDGRASLNSQGAPITFDWRMEASPAEGDGTLENGATATPTFIAWVPGRYLVSLVVSDGTRTSSPGYITVTVSGVSPSNPNLVFSTGYDSSAPGTAVQVPALLSPLAVSVGGSSLVLRTDGTVWGWGDNWSGQLGDGTTTARTIPVRAIGLSDAIGIAAGTTHSLALRSNHTVWGWGNNTYGQLGSGPAEKQMTPVQLSGLADVTAISAGVAHSMALKSDQTIWTWGFNSSGQLGNGSTASAYSPVPVTGLTEVTRISAGETHCLAIRSDKTVWAWGANPDGRLGDGSLENRPTPVQVSGLTEVKAIAGGGSHSLALKEDGTVWAWGWNYYGQLGDGGTENRAIPVQVAGLSTIVAIAAGDSWSLAIRSDGTAWAWGYNGNGQLGDGTKTHHAVPVQVMGVGGILAIGAGLSNSVLIGVFDSPPAVASTWPDSNTCEPGATEIIVGFNRAVLNVTSDDLVLSGGVVTSVTGSGAGPYVFEVADLPQSPVTVSIQGDITDASGQPLTTYQWTFGNAGAPTITQQPVAQATCPGNTVQFTIEATGADSYRWQKDGAELSEGGHYAGVAGPTLTVSGADSADAGSYRCVAAGNCPVTSDAAVLTVPAQPTVTTQPQDRTICIGSTAIFTVETAGSDNLHYHWYRDEVELVDGDRITGATSTTLSIGNCSLEDAGSRYKVVATDECDQTVVSNTVTLTVADGANVAITAQPRDHICTAGDVTFTVTATGYGTLQYQWYLNGGMLEDSEHISGANTAALLIHNCSTDDYGPYTVAIADDCGGWVASAEAYLTDPTDCNHNGQPDADDIASGAIDCDSDGVPDECGFGDGQRPVSQWATSVIAFSTQYADSDWSAQQATGQPNTFEYGDIGTAWASSSENGTQEFITLGFGQPVLAEGVTIRETLGNGMVSQIDLLDLDDQLHTVWSGVDPSQPGAPVDFRVDWPRTSFEVKGVMITIDTDHDPSWEEIDAVQLYGIGSFLDCNRNGIPDVCDIAGADPDCDGNGFPDSCDVAAGRTADCNQNGISDACDLIKGTSQTSVWAASVLGFSSQWSETDNSAQQATGEPDTGTYGDAPTAWAPASQNGTHEYLTVGITLPLFVSAIAIRETAGNGMVYQVDLIDVEDHVYTMWQGIDSSQPGSPADFQLTWPRTNFQVKGVKIYLDTDHDPGWEEIDAVRIDGVTGPFDCNGDGIPDGCEPDSDGDRVPDGCDVCPQTGTDVPVDVQGCPMVFPPCSTFIGADLDHNCVVDFRDLSWFRWCWSGPGLPMHEAWYCVAVDFDGDADVDQADFGIFQRCYNGVGRPVDPNCAK